MKRLSFLVTMLVALMLLASCSKQQGQQLVPEDALFVMRIDAKQASEKSGLTGDKSELSKWLKKQVKAMGLDKEVRDKVLDILDDPTKSGIDLTEPLYLYAAGDLERDPDFGIVGTMASKSNLIDLIKALDVFEVEESNGVSYCELDRDAALIFNGDWFFGGKVDDVDDMIATLKERAGGKGSLDGNKAFDKMCDKKGVMQVLFLGEGLENIPNASEMTAMMPDGLDVKDFASIVDFGLNPGEAVLEAEFVPMSQEWQKYVDKSLKAMKSIDDAQTKYISDKGLSLFLNIDPKMFLEQISNLAEAYEIDDESMEMIEDVLENFDGTASLEFSGIKDNQPSVSLYVGTKNEDALGLLLQNIGDMDEFQEVGDNQYLFPTDYDYDWESEDFSRTPTAWAALGFKNVMTYFSTDKESVFSTPREKYPVKEIKGKGMYLRFNADLFDTLAKEASGSDKQLFDALSDLFDYAECYNGEGATGVMRIVMKDKKKNPVEAIADYVKKFLD